MSRRFQETRSSRSPRIAPQNERPKVVALNWGETSELMYAYVEAFAQEQDCRRALFVACQRNRRFAPLGDLVARIIANEGEDSPECELLLSHTEPLPFMIRAGYTDFKSIVLSSRLLPFDVVTMIEDSLVDDVLDGPAALLIARFCQSEWEAERACNQARSQRINSFLKSINASQS